MDYWTINKFRSIHDSISMKLIFKFLNRMHGYFRFHGMSRYSSTSRTTKAHSCISLCQIISKFVVSTVTVVVVWVIVIRNWKFIKYEKSNTRFIEYEWNCHEWNSIAKMHLNEVGCSILKGKIGSLCDSCLLVSFGKTARSTKFDFTVRKM